MFDPSALDTITACYHEAGHAMIAHWIGGTVLMCTIETEDDTLGGRTSVEWRGLSTAERRGRSPEILMRCERGRGQVCQS